MTQAAGLFATLDAIADAMSAAQMILGALAALQVATLAVVALLLRGAGRTKVETLARDPLVRVYSFAAGGVARVCDCDRNKSVRAAHGDVELCCTCPVRR